MAKWSNDMKCPNCGIKPKINKALFTTNFQCAGCKETLKVKTSIFFPLCVIYSLGGTLVAQYYYQQGMEVFLGVAFGAVLVSILLTAIIVIFASSLEIVRSNDEQDE